MKLLVKFNLLLIAVFGFGLLLISYAARSFLQKQAQAEVLREASLMSAGATATRDYTEREISPLLEKPPSTPPSSSRRLSPSSLPPVPSTSCARAIPTSPTRRRR